jgi:hypothetical protein
LLDAHVVEAFTADGSLTPIPLPDFRRLVGFPAVYKIDYSIITNVAELEPNEIGFGALGFIINQDAGVADDFGLGWSPSTETIDTNGDLPGGIVPLFYDNLDAGPSSSDLYGILVSIGPRIFITSPTDPRYSIGKFGPTYIGSTHLVWDGLSPARSFIQAPNSPGPGLASEMAQFAIATYDFRVASGNYPATTILFGYAPEPTSAVLLLGMASISKLLRGLR